MFFIQQDGLSTLSLKEIFMKKMTLILNGAQLSSLLTLAKKANRKAEDGYQDVYVQLDPKTNTLLMIAGSCMDMHEWTISNVDIPFRRTVAFSLAADSLFEGLNMMCKNSRIVIEQIKSSLFELGFPDLKKFRRVISSNVKKVHIDYMTQRDESNFQSMKCANLSQILKPIEDAKPFELMEVKAVDGVVVINTRRDNKNFKQERKLNSQLNVEMTFTENVFDELNFICKNNPNDNIEVSMQPNVIFIKSKSGSSRFSIDGINSFQNRKTDSHSEVVNFILDAYKLKDELMSYIALRELKKQEQSYLFIYNNKVMVNAYSEHNKCAEMINIIESSNDEYREVFLVNLHHIKNLKVRDITSHHKMRVSIDRFESGEHRLSFFSHGESQYPFFSIRIVPAPDAREKVLSVYSEYCKQLEDQQDNTDKQLDMLGYGGLMNI